MKKTTVLTMLSLCMAVTTGAQTFEHYKTTDSQKWQKGKTVRASAEASGKVIETDVSKPIVTFRKWGTTFNEQDWKALCLLQRTEQDEILRKAFSPDGELRLSMGRISMNANDYALSWYSCSEVQGDFDLAYFNIERDKMTIIPYIRCAARM